MKITVVVTKTTYGTFDIEVPEDSVLNSEASIWIKKKAAKQLAKKAIEENRADITWGEPEPIQINSGYFAADENEKSKGGE